MNYTSERVSPNDYQHNHEEYLIYLLHVQTYEHILKHVKDKAVLDFGCGEGYGTNLISKHSTSVIGIDISDETIADAQAKYAASNIQLQTIKPIETSPLPFKDESFDVVVSFQVIEHIFKDDIYLKEICRVLKPDGLVMIATPNGTFRLLPFQNPWNKYHVREYTHTQFLQIMKNYFTDVKIEGMSISEPWLRFEIKRTNRNKWLLWPLTCKLWPFSIRSFFLRIIWNTFAFLKKKNSQKETVENPNLLFLKDTPDNIAKSPSLIAFAQKLSK